MAILNFKDAVALQNQIEKLTDPILDDHFGDLDAAAATVNCAANTDCCYGLDLPKRGDKHTAASAAACSALCTATHGCVAFVFKPASECWLKSAVKASEGHPATWPSAASCMGLRNGPPVPAPPPGSEGFWEMSIVPQQRLPGLQDTGKEQPTFFRFVQTVNKTATQAVYFDSFAYIPSWCASDTLADCDAPSNFYSAMLDTHFFWKGTFEQEHAMRLDLPRRPDDTDGVLLAAQASHALVLDMITRTGHNMWPRYGTAPGYEQPGIGADGFQEIFTATMMASLEWGMFGYAKGVLDNWLTFFLKDNGFVLYRGLEMAQHGRMLTNMAQYYK